MSVVLAPLEVAPGISMLSVRTPTLPPATHTNTFLLGTGELLLVEPASPYDREIDAMADWVSGQLAHGKRLRAILVTHHHADHVGGAARLRERLGVPLWAHEATRERLLGRVTIDRLLTHGERVALDGPAPMTVEAVHTPGHAAGHLCFLELASRSLIAGDMVAGVGTILIEPGDGDMQQYLDSLRLMEHLESSQLLPAHGLPIANPRERLRFYVQHRLMREAKVASALGELGEATLDQLLAIAYADAAPAARPLARLSAEAHLIKLEREGRAARRGERWLSVS